MEGIKRLRYKLEGLIKAINRYPLTTLFLLATAIVNMISINNDTDEYFPYMFTFIVGAFLSAVGQLLYERFFIKTNIRWNLMVGSILLAGGYYLAIHSANNFNEVNEIKTAVAIFALMIAFIWVPTIKNTITFNESFLSAFKAFFITVLFTAVISIGISAIILAIDTLLFKVDDQTIPQFLNGTLTLFAPIFFLSFTPLFPGKRDINKTTDESSLQEDMVKKAIGCPKFLNVLISNIIIPLTVVYTVILVIYVILNIRGDFWSKNLLEPLLVSYAITVILVYILSSNLDNKMSTFFRKIFPKVLVPIVLFQTIASILKIQEMGLTHGRYYAILFGIFAVIAGLIFSFLPVQKNGRIAAVLIAFSMISIIPPMDAFSVSRVSQINLLKEVLQKNDMLQDQQIVPNEKISLKDKKTITRTVSYLDRMNYTKAIDWLPEKIMYDSNFKSTFGFDEVYDEPGLKMTDYQSAYLEWERSPVVMIKGYDLMIHVNANSEEFRGSEKEIPLKIDGENYSLKQEKDGDFFVIRIIDAHQKELIQFNTKQITDKILNDHQEKDTLTVDKATVPIENNNVKLKVVVNSVEKMDDQYTGDFYIFLHLK